MDTTELAIPELSTDAARDKLVRDLLQRAYTDGRDPQRDQAVVAAWQQFTGMGFFRTKPTATYLRGFPGQGKTTAFISAAQTAANLLNMRLVIQPEDPVPIDRNTLLVAIINLSGEVSNLAVSGVPKIDTPHGGDLSFTRRVPPFALAAARQAGLAVVLFDDMPNASPNIQNVANDMLDRGRAQGLDLGPHTLVGATGNLGALDATAVNSTSTATATRVNNYLVQDNVDDWCRRVRLQYRDTIGAAMVPEFLKQNPDLFHKPTRRRHGEPYPTSRSWSRALEEHLRPLFSFGRHLIAQNAKPGEIEGLIDRHMQLAAGLIGIEAADKLGLFYRATLNHCLPLAMDVLDYGQLSKENAETFKSLYGDGVSADSEHFLAQFAGILCDEAAQRLVAYYGKDPAAFRDTAQALMTGLYQYTNTTAHLGWVGHRLADRIAQVTNNPEIGEFDPQIHAPRLRSEFMAQFLRAINGHPYACAPAESGKTLFEETMLNEMLGHNSDTLANLNGILQAPASQPKKAAAPGM